MKLPALRTPGVDLLNLLLLLGAFALAWWLPFRLFLFAYAVLGPLHYLTEMNWLHDRNYFIQSKGWIALPLVVATFVFLPQIAQLLTPESGWPESIAWGMAQVANSSNGLIFWWLIVSAGLLFLKTTRHRLILGAIGLVVSLVLLRFPTYLLLVGLMIPTLIHVYLFTGLFMLYGAQRSQSKLGFLNVAVLFLVPVIIVILPLDPGNYHFTDALKDTFLGSNFHVTNAKIAGFLGLNEGKTFFFYEVMEIKLQVFIAFAYSYHYLNWFSKTTTIGWHKNLTTGRTVTIAGIWLASIGLYAWDYRTGLAVLVSLSTLHVLLEFPLNLMSIRGIGQHLFARSTPR
ncbi:MAG: hypothetical protein ACFB10_06990 [Salibacteraceae bacterium]